MWALAFIGRPCRPQDLLDGDELVSTACASLARRSGPTDFELAIETREGPGSDVGRALRDRLANRSPVCWVWGQSVIEQTARDLRASFPGTQGSRRATLWDMRRFYDAYVRTEVLRQLAAEGSEPVLRCPGRSTAVASAATRDTKVLRQLVAEVPWGLTFAGHRAPANAHQRIAMNLEIVLKMPSSCRCNLGR